MKKKHHFWDIGTSCSETGMGRISHFYPNVYCFKDHCVTSKMSDVIAWKPLFLQIDKDNEDN